MHSDCVRCHPSTGTGSYFQCPRFPSPACHWLKVSIPSEHSPAPNQTKVRWPPLSPRKEAGLFRGSEWGPSLRPHYTRAFISPLLFPAFRGVLTSTNSITIPPGLPSSQLRSTLSGAQPPPEAGAALQLANRWASVPPCSSLPASIFNHFLLNWTPEGPRGRVR